MSLTRKKELIEQAIIHEIQQIDRKIEVLNEQIALYALSGYELKYGSVENIPLGISSSFMKAKKKGMSKEELAADLYGQKEVFEQELKRLIEDKMILEFSLKNSDFTI